MLRTLVLDLGSSSTRACVYDDQALILPGATARQPLDFITGRDGRSEDDADQALRRVVAAVDEIVGRQSGADAIAMSAYACSLVCLDDDGHALTPVFTYADTRAAEDARTVRRDVDELAAVHRTGCRIRANYWPARMAWIKRAMPEVFRQTRWFVSLSDYLYLRLTGRLCAGVSVASWTGMIQRDTRDWDDEWLACLGVRREQFPAILPEGEMVGHLADQYAGRWPVLRDAIVCPALGDGAAANIGSGCVDGRSVAITIGSTGAMRVVVPHSTPRSSLPASLWAYRVDHGHELIGGATTEGGNVYAWLHDHLRLPDAPCVEPVIAAMQPDAHGLTVLPMFAGERSPGFADDARATLHGLTLDTTPVDIVRACMEAIAYRLAQVGCAIMDTPFLREAGHVPTLIASGGALLASPTWRQIIADASGARVQVCVEPEATSRGAALMAMRELGVIVGLGDLPARLGETHDPDPERGAIYRAAMQRQQRLYERLLA